MRFVHNDGEETLLPEMASPTTHTIDEQSVTAVQRAKEFREALSMVRDDDKMHVVGHQAIGQDRNTRLIFQFFQKFEVS